MPQSAQPRESQSRPELHEVLPPDCVELHALPFELHAEGEGQPGAPEWVHLSPAGELDEKSGEMVVRGRDGRRFVIDDHAAVLAGTELPMQFDWEHLSMYGIWGGDRATRAAGWIDRLEWVDKPDAQRTERGFWGHVARWTPDGRSDVEQGYYRGLSPVVRYQNREPVMEGDEPPPPLLRGLVNVALTNRPNLRMTLLHAEEHDHAHAAREGSMNEHEKALRARLGLPETATHAEVARAVLAQFDSLVPRAELEAVLHRAQTAETELKRIRDEAHATELNRVIEDGRKSGKIIPALVEHYRTMFAAVGIEKARAAVAAMPVVVADDHRRDDDPPGTDGGKMALTAHQKKLAADMGLTEDEYRAAL